MNNPMRNALITVASFLSLTLIFVITTFTLFSQNSKANPIPKGPTFKPFVNQNLLNSNCFSKADLEQSKDKNLLLMNSLFRCSIANHFTNLQTIPQLTLTETKANLETMAHKAMYSVEYTDETKIPTFFIDPIYSEVLFKGQNYNIQLWSNEKLLASTIDILNHEFILDPNLATQNNKDSVDNILLHDSKKENLKKVALNKKYWLVVEQDGKFKKLDERLAVEIFSQQLQNTTKDDKDKITSLAIELSLLSSKLRLIEKNLPDSNFYPTKYYSEDTRIPMVFISSRGFDKNAAEKIIAQNKDSFFNFNSTFDKFNNIDLTFKLLDFDGKSLDFETTNLFVNNNSLEFNLKRTKTKINLVDKTNLTEFKNSALINHSIIKSIYIPKSSFEKI